jgi:hypothetical protein
MKCGEIARNRHVVKREAVLAKLGKMRPFMEGSLCAVKRRGCAAPGWQLTWKKKGKTCTVYVPMELVAEVTQWTKEYKRLKQIIREGTSQSLGIVRGFAANRSAANRKRV